MSLPREPDKYLLPAQDIPFAVRQRLHPWIAGFIGLTPEQANRRVAERWSSVDRPSLRALRQTLSQFSVQAIVDYGSGGRLEAARPTEEEEEACGDLWYLPAPLDREEVSSRLAACRLQANDSLREFLDHFAGLAEDTIIAGDFVYSDEPWPLFTDSWDGAIEGFDAWEGSLMLYHARDGCHVLVRSDGAVAWWMMQEHRVAPFAENFDQFIHLFSEHRKTSSPFDPYGVPDDDLR